MKSCENCGCRVSRLGCENCNEAHYIDEQYADLGMETPESIYEEMREKPIADCNKDSNCLMGTRNECEFS